VPPPQQQIFKCQHCDRVGHVRDHFLDPHTCKHCGKHTHSSNKLLKKKPLARKNIHFGWISWQWASMARKIFKSHHIIYSQILKGFIIAISSYSHHVSNRGELVVIYKLHRYIKQD